jgi:hypothetical protein
MPWSKECTTVSFILNKILRVSFLFWVTLSPVGVVLRDRLRVHLLALWSDARDKPNSLFSRCSMSVFDVMFFALLCGMMRFQEGCWSSMYCVVVSRSSGTAGAAPARAVVVARVVCRSSYPLIPRNGRKKLKDWLILLIPGVDFHSRSSRRHIAVQLPHGLNYAWGS